MKGAFIYIMASKENGTLYVGTTSNLVKRVYEHKNKITKGFTSRYGVNRLVYYEIFDDMKRAIEREKQLKRWHRSWKLNLINTYNPKWNDLYNTIIL
jgi:putative endonuclease